MDTVARLGGDEFVVLAPDLDGHMAAVDIGARLVAELSRHPDRVGGHERVAASDGISISAGGRGTPEVLLHEADTAMYQAKSLGRGRAEVFDAALRLHLDERAAGRLMLQLALDESRIIVYYQPIVELSTGRVAGFEALARITEPDGLVVGPDAFINIAEESGLVVPLGAQVLAVACREARGWRPADLATAPLSVAVNLSPRQLESGDLT
jgi:predicted signal transduction protein with EAL and GGDEF domain